MVYNSYKIFVLLLYHKTCIMASVEGKFNENN